MPYKLNINERNKKRREEWGNDKKPSKSKNKSIANAAYTRARLMPESIKEFVSKTRIEFFGKDNPPFDDIEAMGEWIRKEAKSQPPAEGHAPRFGYKIEKNITIKQLNILYKLRPGIYGSEYAKLDYPIKDGWTSSVIVSDGSLLRRLWLAVLHISKELDCQEAQATAFILAGKLPYIAALSAFAHQTINKDNPNKGKIEITIREPISEQELIKAYRKLKHSLWGKINHQPASERDCKLVEFVTQNLDINNPKWEKLMSKWNKEYPNFAFKGYSGFRGFRKSYIDAKRKVYPEIHWGNVIFTD